MELFDANGYYTGPTIPDDCVTDCAAQGRVDGAVDAWRYTLNFEVPRKLAISYLREFGAWTRGELDYASDELLAERVLWIACCELKESGNWLGLVH